MAPGRPRRVRRVGLCRAINVACSRRGLGPALGAPGHCRRCRVVALIVIVDGSGSMWAPIDGRVSQARPGARCLAARPRQDRRRRASALRPSGTGAATAATWRSCAPEPLTSSIMAPLEQLNPRGRGPLTLALREAAKSLPRDAGPRSLLLIHDDADNCQPDLCAAAAELRAAEVTAHVIGLALKAETSRRWPACRRPRAAAASTRRTPSRSPAASRRPCSRPPRWAAAAPRLLRRGRLVPPPRSRPRPAGAAPGPARAQYGAGRPPLSWT